MPLPQLPVLAVALLVLDARGCGASWAMEGGNAQRSGQVGFDGPRTPSVVWSYLPGALANTSVAGYSIDVESKRTAVVEWGGALFLTLSHPQQAKLVVALNASSGAQLWATPIGLAAGVRTGPLAVSADGGRVLLATRAGSLLGLHAGTGQLLHATPVHTPASSSTPWHNYASAVVVGPDGDAFVAFTFAAPPHSRALYRVSTASGAGPEPQAAWRFDVPGETFEVGLGMSADSDPAPTLSTDGSLVFIPGRALLVAVHAASGVEAWRSLGDVGEVRHAAVGRGPSAGLVFLCGVNATKRTVTAVTLRAVNASTGATAWDAAFPLASEPRFTDCEPRVGGGEGGGEPLVYLALHPRLLAFRVRDGSLAWNVSHHADHQASTAPAGSSSPPAIGADGRLYVASGGGRLSVVDGATGSALHHVPALAIHAKVTLAAPALEGGAGGAMLAVVNSGAGSHELLVMRDLPPDASPTGTVTPTSTPLFGLSPPTTPAATTPWASPGWKEEGEEPPVGNSSTSARAMRDAAAALGTLAGVTALVGGAALVRARRQRRRWWAAGGAGAQPVAHVLWWRGGDGGGSTEAGDPGPSTAGEAPLRGAARCNPLRQLMRPQNFTPQAPQSTGGSALSAARVSGTAAAGPALQPAAQPPPGAPHADTGMAAMMEPGAGGDAAAEERADGDSSAAAGGLDDTDDEEEEEEQQQQQAVAAAAAAPGGYEKVALTWQSREHEHPAQAGAPRAGDSDPTDEAASRAAAAAGGVSQQPRVAPPPPLLPPELEAYAL